MDEVHEFLLRKKPLMLLISSTSLTEEIEDNEIDCDGYKCFRNDSHSRHTGGCCVCVRSDQKAEVFSSATLDKKVWILAIKLHNVGDEYVFTVVYFSPNGGKKKCVEFFDNWCEDNIVHCTFKT